MDADGREKPDLSTASVRQSRKNVGGDHDRIVARAGLFGLAFLAALPLAALPAPSRRLRRRLSGPSGALADRLSRRRPGRHRGAHHEPGAVGAFRPAIRGREPRRLRRQYRDRGRGQRDAGRLHAAVQRRQQRDLGLALQAPAVRFHPRHRAGRAASRRCPTCWWCRTRCRSRPSRS